MPYPAKTIADGFLRLAARDSRRLTNMQLQKLVFIAHGFYMAVHDDRPLVDETAKAWQWGPVFPKLYKQFMRYGAQPITETPTDDQAIGADADVKALIENVWQTYGRFSASQLSAITHLPDAPWSKAWEEQEFSIIDDKVTSDYYQELLLENAS